MSRTSRVLRTTDDIGQVLLLKCYFILTVGVWKQGGRTLRADTRRLSSPHGTAVGYIASRKCVHIDYVAGEDKCGMWGQVKRMGWHEETCQEDALTTKFLQSVMSSVNIKSQMNTSFISHTYQICLHYNVFATFMKLVLPSSHVIMVLRLPILLFPQPICAFP